MSLDVYLKGPKQQVPCCCPECDNEHERVTREGFYESNITHNLATMADAVGIFKHLWMPEEIGITKASQLIEPLSKGLALLEADPAKFQQYNASNGWGLYEHFVPFVRNYLEACREYPDATVEVSP